ncbi:putative multidrug resistance ABC transporter ATP-binding/permease YheH [Gossypium arboreum]|uniref:Putative multidrug resistance ABC transporter ATP-binding/permease YheH n=1 Tax=Gossypium arboreum TaxID=29729 RepID=A0A0B0PJP2_GOSAR|nr:putative multidrug resistance ABC transporter ATP-binding/permease YheH [Gossypium arboreum]
MCNLLSFMFTPSPFPFSYSVAYLAQGSTEVRDIDHTINRSFRYSLIYIFEYGMYSELNLCFVSLSIIPNVLVWDKSLILY